MAISGLPQSSLPLPPGKAMPPNGGNCQSQLLIMAIRRGESRFTGPKSPPRRGQTGTPDPPVAGTGHRGPPCHRTRNRSGAGLSRVRDGPPGAARCGRLARWQSPRPPARTAREPPPPVAWPGLRGNHRAACGPWSGLRGIGAERGHQHGDVGLPSRHRRVGRSNSITPDASRWDPCQDALEHWCFGRLGLDSPQDRGNQLRLSSQRWLSPA